MMTTATTTNDPTATTDKKRKRKKKRRKKKPATTATNGTTSLTVTNQPVGGQEALPLPGGTTTNGSTGAQEALAPPSTTTTNLSTATTGQKQKKKTTAARSPSVDAQEVLPQGSSQEHNIQGGKQLITIKLHEAIVNSKADDPPRTGRLSEAAVHQYFVERLGPSNVEWVNQERESGLPYDIVITEHGFRECVKVKGAMAPDKKGFRHIIQPWEWQFLSEKGDSSSIAHVSFPSPDEAAIVMLRNPRMLCKKDKDLGPALVMSKEFKERFRENMSKISVVLKPDCYLNGTNWILLLKPPHEVT
ncbi:uncharacterized protein C2845_PM04G14550 [Panicum miliaceum]|uniref:Protein NO VEIN C-terminal domain-containing protein n=1 Tax=Panicum miliaceum TaxID=4540 RepID=A0A3L6QS96_PANMI|nr:uncharacterized protein C2845_PM04G14550 [Panicum miliaceum]